MLIVVTVETQQLPVTAIVGIVVVVMIPVVDGQLMHIGPREFTGATAAHPRKPLERAFPVTATARTGGTLGRPDNAVEL